MIVLDYSGKTTAGTKETLLQTWQSAPQLELAAGAPHPSLHLKLHVLEPKALQIGPPELREAKAVMLATAKMGEQAQRDKGAPSKQLQLGHTALSGRVH